MSGRLSRPLVLAIIVISTSSPAGAQVARPQATVATVAGAGTNSWSGNIRASDQELLSLLADGVKRSPTLRSLADRLTSSDVIVYVRPDVTARGSTQGRLTFLSSSGGYRYLTIHIPAAPSKQHQLAILGQELRHAVAVADARSVVDSESLLREFERIGNVRHSTNGRISFESSTGAETRQRILREVAGEG